MMLLFAGTFLDGAGAFLTGLASLVGAIVALRAAAAKGTGSNRENGKEK